MKPEAFKPRCPTCGSAHIERFSRTWKVTTVLSVGPFRLGNMYNSILTDSATANLYAFKEDYPFTSQSAAADVVAGASRNGRTFWKHKESGLTY